MELSSEGITFRVVSKSKWAEELDGDHARLEDVRELYVGESDLYIAFEKQRFTLANQFRALLGRPQKGINDQLGRVVADLRKNITKEKIEELGFEVQPITESEIRSLFSNKKEYLKEDIRGLEVDDSYIGVLKLVKPGSNSIALEDVVYSREALPLPYEIHLRCEKISEASAHANLHRRSKQEESGTSRVSAVKYYDAQETLEGIELHGSKLYKYELHVVLKRDCKTELKNSLEVAKRELKLLGEFSIERYGALPSYATTLLGSKSHLPLIEKQSSLPIFVPGYLNASKDREAKNSRRTFAYQRVGGSLSYFDLFNKKYSSYSAVIVGESGRGKSVFSNMLIKCLLNDENTKVILVDVRGSHGRLTNMMGGKIYDVELDRPSGINPISYLEKSQSRQTIEIVTTFLAQLMLEENEVDLSIKDKGLLEESIFKYIESKPKVYSLDSAIEKMKDHPRVDYLKRWARNGLYGRVFEKISTEENRAQLSYYNFSSIATAGNKSVSSAVIAAIMAQFSFELSQKKPGEKLVFIADETPFFVKHCFSSFKMLMKNVRKLGGSQILIVQESEDLVVNGDESLINTAAIKILFSLDGDREVYKRRFNLKENEISLLENILVEKGKCSRFLLKDDVKSHEGVLVLSSREYLTSTTEEYDTKKIEDIKDIYPNLNDDQVAAILKITRLSTQVEAAL